MLTLLYKVHKKQHHNINFEEFVVASLNNIDFLWSYAIQYMSTKVTPIRTFENSIASTQVSIHEGCWEYTRLMSTMFDVVERNVQSFSPRDFHE